MKRTPRLATIAVAAVLAVAAAGCGAAATPTPQTDAEQAACDALQAWSDEMREFVALDPATASADDVKAQAQTVEDSWAAVKDAMGGVESADEAAVEAGWAALETALQDIPSDVPIADAIAGVKAAAEPLKSAYQQMANGIDCKIATPY